MAVSTLAGRIDEALFNRLPALEVVANFGVGYDNIDARAASSRRIVVTDTPGVLDEEVADLAMSLLLATIRRIPLADRFVRDGCWGGGRSFSALPDITRQTVGHPRPRSDWEGGC